MSRRRRHMETSEVALMAVMTKAMGAFLILMVFGMQYFVPDMTAEQISQIIQQSLQRAKSDLSRIEQNLDKGGAGASGGGQTQTDIAEALKRLDEAAADTERLRVRLDQAIAQLRHSEEERTRLTAETDQLKAELEKTRALAASLQAKLAAMTAERDKLQAELQSLAQARQDLAQAANALKRGDVTKEELAAIKTQVDAARSKLEALDATNADLRARLAAAQDEIKRLQDANAALDTAKADLTKERDDLRRENADMKANWAQVNAETLFEVLFPKSCGDAKLSLLISRLSPKYSDLSISDATRKNLWSPVVRGDKDANFDVSDFGIFTSNTYGRNVSTEFWIHDNVKDGERLAINIYQTNAVGPGHNKCDFTFIGMSRAPQGNKTAHNFTLDDSQFNFYEAGVFEYSRVKGLTEIDVKSEESDELFQKVFAQSKCMALTCDPHNASHRAELHDLLQDRYAHDIAETDGIEADETAAARKMLDGLIDDFGEDRMSQADLERWIGLLKTTAIAAKDTTSSPPSLAPAAIGVMTERLIQADAPAPVVDRFKARALKGWWTADDARARLEAAKIASIATDFDAALGKKNLPQGSSGLAGLARPMVESGTMTLAQGLEWVALMATPAPSGSDPDPAALARTDEAMRKKGLDQPFIAAVGAALRAKQVRLVDVDRAVAQTAAVVP